MLLTPLVYQDRLEGGWRDLENGKEGGTSSFRYVESEMPLQH